MAVSTVSGFRVVEEVHRSQRTTVVRALRESDGARVLLKASPADPSRLRHEARVLRRLQGEGIVRLLDEVVHEGRPVLVLADSGGQSLRSSSGALAPGEVVDVALQATRALARVHGQGYLHQDVNPSNLVLTPAGTLELIDFGLAAPAGEASGHPVGTLAYLSPEQTGRTGRRADPRSDYYSLGATLYELLTGQPPFAAADALEVVHAHLARRAAAPHQVDPAVPPGLSDLVMKLLAKSPDDRYQSAEGLLHDLQALRDRPGERLPLGTRDVPRTLTFPQKLYGREREVQALRDALERARAGATEICLVHGPSGVGKSSLVGELRPPVDPGPFLVAKADRLGRTVPYAPLVQALDDHVGRVLGCPQDTVEAWRERVAGALGDLGALLVEAVPEAGRLLGKQPPVAELPPEEAAHRLDRVLLRFLRCLGLPGHPVVLFLDDLQWADLGTLRLAEALAAEDLPLLLVAAWRSDEVDPAHPLPTTLDRLQASPARVTDLPLEDLGIAALVSLLEDTLRCPAGEAASLADLVARKTRGNPFFLRQFLEALHSRGHLRFSPTSGGWLWDADQVEGADITDNVARMLEARLGDVPASTREALQAAACAGPCFPLEQAAWALGRPVPEVAEALRPALEEGLLLGLLEGAQPLRFLHDRVHEAVLAGLPE